MQAESGSRGERGGASASELTLAQRSSALKERIYATFTGLAIISAVSAADHATAQGAFVSVAVGVLGISAAGLLADVIAHQVTHQRLPEAHEVGIMAKIALGALGSASLPLLFLALAWIGVLPLTAATTIGTVIYAATLVVILLIASRRSGLRPLQRLASVGMLVGLALLVVAVLTIAHLH